MDTAELEWIAWTTPITTVLGIEVAAGDLSGRTVACRQHILADTICIVAPLIRLVRAYEWHRAIRTAPMIVLLPTSPRSVSRSAPVQG